MLPHTNSHYFWPNTGVSANFEGGINCLIKQAASPAIIIGLSTGIISASAKDIDYGVTHGSETPE